MRFPLGHHFFGTTTFHETRHPIVFAENETNCEIWKSWVTLWSFPRSWEPVILSEEIDSEKSSQPIPSLLCQPQQGGEPVLRTWCEMTSICFENDPKIHFSSNSLEVKIIASRKSLATAPLFANGNLQEVGWASTLVGFADKSCKNAKKLTADLLLISSLISSATKGERLNSISNWALHFSFLPFRSLTVWKASRKLVTASATFSTFDVVTLFHLHSSPGDQLPPTTPFFSPLWPVNNQLLILSLCS